MKVHSNDTKKPPQKTDETPGKGDVPVAPSKRDEAPVMQPEKPEMEAPEKTETS